MGHETKDTTVFKKLSSQHSNSKKILAEGDSWFAYPKKFFFLGGDSNIIDHLEEKPDLLILNTSRNGDEIVDMISGSQKFSLLKKITHMDFDLLFLSGGGNDIVGKYDFGFNINKCQDGMTWEDCINMENLKIKISQIQNAYEEIIKRVMSINPTLPILTHTYDLPRPGPTGFEVFDVFPIGKSWMYPYFIENGITDPIYQKNILRKLFTEFKETLIGLKNKFPNNFFVVDTQGTLNDGQSEERNSS